MGDHTTANKYTSSKPTTQRGTDKLGRDNGGRKVKSNYKRVKKPIPFHLSDQTITCL